MKSYAEAEREAIDEVKPYIESRLEEVRELMLNLLMYKKFTSVFSHEFDRACELYQGMVNIAINNEGYQALYPSSRTTEFLIRDYFRYWASKNLPNGFNFDRWDVTYANTVKKRGYPEIKRRLVSFLKREIDKRIKKLHRALEHEIKEERKLKRWMEKDT